MRRRFPEGLSRFQIAVICSYVMAAIVLDVAVILPLWTLRHPVRAYRVVFLGDPDDVMCK